MRKLQISIAVLALLLLVADRVGAVVAADVIATRLQAAGSLSDKPHVSIQGFPFLTQAVSGRYDRIELTADNVRRRTVSLEAFAVSVHGAQLSLSDALAGHVASVPVEGLTATAVVSYATISSRFRMLNVILKPAGRELEVTGTLTIGGQRYTVHELAGVRLEGSKLVVSPRSIGVKPEPKPAVLAAVLPVLELSIPTGTLPFGLRLTSLKVAPEGLVLSASSGPTVLQRP